MTQFDPTEVRIHRLSRERADIRRKLIRTYSVPPEGIAADTELKGRFDNSAALFLRGDVTDKENFHETISFRGGSWQTRLVRVEQQNGKMLSFEEKAAISETAGILIARYVDAFYLHWHTMNAMPLPVHPRFLPYAEHSESGEELYQRLISTLTLEAFSRFRAFGLNAQASYSLVGGIVGTAVNMYVVAGPGHKEAAKVPPRPLKKILSEEDAWEHMQNTATHREGL